MSHCLAVPSRVVVRPAPSRASARLPLTRLALGLAVLSVLGGVAPVTAQSAGTQPASAQAPAAAASAGAYNVEVIVFRGNGPREDSGGAPPTRSARDADSSSGTAQAARFLKPLPASALQLSGARQRLATGGYKVLAHAGWTQTASSWGSRSGLPIERVGVQSPGLSGVFLLERGSLLHFGMNLKFTADNGATWQLSEIRRVRLNEKNYYDNPGLGVIAVVTPITR